MLRTYKKPRVCCYDKVRQHLPTKRFDRCVYMLCWRVALLKLKLVICFEIIKNMK